MFSDDGIQADEPAVLHVSRVYWNESVYSCRSKIEMEVRGENGPNKLGHSSFRVVFCQNGQYTFVRLLITYTD